MQRGNLNLVFGIFATTAAAAMLAYVAFTAKSAEDDWHRYLPIYLLRLSVVMFIEIFAFFFLRLYRASLTEIKYFQNEITNLEAKCLALEFAIVSSDQMAAGKVVDQLSQTERNFILKKDETTIDLEKARLDAQHVHEVAAAIKDIMPSRKAKSE